VSRDVEEDGNQGPKLLDASSLGVEAGDSEGLKRVTDDRKEGHRRCNVSKTRHQQWRRDTDDLKLESGSGSLRLLSLLGGGGALTKGLEGDEGCGQVGCSNGGS
jgi:hypothetical protein